ncbi:MAG TPA: transaldolase [Solirubrobacteraceae bacterium]|jgi:transaldolase|nr:transaldolase [Solirubrobacteraceae bacterium]
MSSPLHRLSEHGQSVWIDFISRTALASGGDIPTMIADDAVVGLTSNPTIFEQAISSGDAYDDQIRSLSDRHLNAKEVFLELALQDIEAACDLLRPTWEQTGHLDGYVSIEVDPTLAHDAAATIAEAQELHDRVDRPNVLVKIPATLEGLGAIEETIAVGVSVNVTLIFSLERYVAVAEAYLAGLERLVAAGGDPSTIASVASFFVSRVDTEGDKRLEAAGHPELCGKLAIANAKLAYERYQELFSSQRFTALKDKGATPQRCLWASTSTKNPAYRDVLYVEELIGRETVNTMPEATVRAFADHGVVEDTLTRDLPAAHALIDQLRAVGVEYEDVTATIEREGVEKFEKSFHDLLAGIERKRSALVA